LRNDTVYRNQIKEGIIHNTEIYRIIKKGHQKMTQWIKKHPLVIRNQSEGLEQFDKMQNIKKIDIQKT